MATLEEACRIQCDLAFRVECDVPWPDSQHKTLSEGRMSPRGQHLINGSWRDTVDAHLSWAHVDTPFISLFKTWEHALRKRQWLLKPMAEGGKGGNNTVIIAVWLRGKAGVYDAYEAARRLNYGALNDRRRDLRNHQDEILLWGGISADEYRIPACFYGDSRDLVHVGLRPVHDAGQQISAIPAGSLSVPESGNMTGSLKDEMISLCGVVNEVKLCILVLALCGMEWIMREGDDRVTVDQVVPLVGNRYMFNKA